MLYTLKWITIIVLCVLTCSFVSWKVADSKLEVFQMVEFTPENWGVYTWDGKTYRKYVSLGTQSDLAGKKFAKVDTGSRGSTATIFEVKGYPVEEWVIYRSAPTMGADALYKEDGVTDIPAEFEELLAAYERESQEAHEREEEATQDP
ncbi:MAG: hypothetical protein LBB67_01945 [Oscillospiraceae bacterium]|jgi:hypothetical protein|nr:hypothetical protein [Oscillospiraceae bacterium]